MSFLNENSFRSINVLTLQENSGKKCKENSLQKNYSLKTPNAQSSYL